MVEVKQKVPERIRRSGVVCWSPQPGCPVRAREPTNQRRATGQAALIPRHRVGGSPLAQACQREVQTAREVGSGPSSAALIRRELHAREPGADPTPTLSRKTGHSQVSGLCGLIGVPIADENGGADFAPRQGWFPAAPNSPHDPVPNL